MGELGGQGAKNHSGPSRLVRLPLALIAVGLVPGKALALPEGLVVQGGVIGVSQPDASTLLIQQGTDRAAGDWRSFNIGAAERVTIQQPNASSLMLARVTSGVGTEIFGQLNANGGLLLLNPHGVLIGPGASINTASFAAGTLNADPSRFMQGGPVQLERLPGAPMDAAVINRGSISVADAGLVALISPQVINQGLITARLGTIHLATGTTATLDLNGGTGLYQVALDPALSASLLNQGQIEGQFVRIGAGEAQALLHSAVNLDGLVLARGADGGGGTIEVRTSGDLQVNGRLDANGDAGARGGTIKLLADRVALRDQARVEASGGTAGGEILIGGNYLGRGPEPNARVAVLTPGAEVKADATQQGDGGRVILWSDVYTGFYGTISARGGVNDGNGGFVETSSKDNLQAWGSVDASARHGQSGLWLLDPANITISSSATTSSSSWSTQGPVWQTASATNSANINGTALLTQLNAGTNITITTANASGTGNGDITVATNLTANPSNTATLTLTANNDIDFRATSLSLPKVDLVITAARNVRYGTSNGSTFRSVTQQAGSGTATVWNALNTSGAGGISITSKNISVPSSITAAQGNISLVTTTGNIDFPGTNTTTVEATAGNVTINSAGSISIDSQSSFAPVSFIAGAGNIAFSAATGTTLNGLASFQALGASSGNVTVTGDIDAPASVVSTDEVDAIQVDAAGAVVFNGAIGQVDPLGAIQIDNSQTTTFNNAISLAPLVDPAIATGAIVVNGTALEILFNGNVSASRIVAAAGNYEISFAGSTIQFDGFIWDGANNIAGSAIVDFANTGKVTLGNGSGNVLTFGGGGLGFSGNAAVVLNGTVRSTADPTTNANAIDFGTGGVTVAGPSVVDTTNNGARDEGGNIAFGGAVTGNLQALTIRASTGLGTLDATGVNFAGNVVLNTLTVDPGNYKVSFSGASNIFGTALDFQNSGLVTMGVAGNATNEFTFDNGLAFSGNSVIQLGGTFITPGQAFNLGAGNPTLIANTTVDTTNYNNSPTGGNIAFGGVLGGAYSLTVNAGTGGAITENNIDGLTSLRVVDALMMRVNGYATLDSLTIDKTASGAGNGVIIAGNATINEFVTGNNQFDLTLNGTTNVFGSSQADTQRVQFKNTGNLSLGDDLNDIFLFDDGFEFTGAVGTGGPSQLLLGATIRTTGEAIITNGRAITLVSDSIIDATGGGGITIDAAVNATTAGQQSLTLDTSAAAAGAHTIAITGAIGGTTPLGALTISSADTLTLGANATIATKKLTGTPASTGAISLTAANGITTSAAGATATAPTLASDGGPISVNSDLTLNSDQVVTSAGGAISFAGAVNGSTTRTLSIDGGTGGSASFAGNVSLKGLTTIANKNYSVSLTGTTNAFSNAVAFNNTGVITLGDDATDGFTFTGGVSFAGTAALNLAGTFNTNNTAFSAGSRPTTLAANTVINTGGSGTISFGSVSGAGKTLSIDGGNASFTGNVSLQNLITLTKTASNYTVSLTGATNTFTDLVAFKNNGAITLGDGGDDFTFKAGVSFDGNAALNLGGNVSISNAGVGFNSGNRPITLTSDSGITTNGATISLADLNSPGSILTIDAGNGGMAEFTGTTTLKGLVTAGNAYGISFTGATNTFTDAVAFNNTGTVTFGSNLGSPAHTFSFTNGFSFPGNANISLGALIQTAGQALGFGKGSPTLLADSELDTTWNSTGALVNPNSAGANISLGGNLTGPNFGLTIDAGTGGAISESTITLHSLTIINAASLAVSGNATLSNLTTGNSSTAISFTGTKNTFGTNATTGNGTQIVFANTGALTLGDGGDDFLFNDGVDISAVSGLTLGGMIRTPGMAVSISNPITLKGTGGVDTTSNSAAGAAITVSGTIDGTTAGADNVSFTSGTGDINFSAAIGASTAVGSFTTTSTTGRSLLSSDADIKAGGAVTLTGRGIGSAADISTTGSAITFQSSLTLLGDQVISSAGGAISFADTLAGGGKTLTIDGGNGGSVSFARNVNNLGGLSTKANNYSVSFTGTNNTFNNAVTFNNTGALILGNGANTFTFTGGVTATAPSAISLGGNVSAAGTGVISLGALNVTGSSTVGGASTGTITLGDATLADGATLTVGAGAATPINLAAVAGTLNGTASNLTLNTTAAVNVSGAIGTDIGTLTITSSGGTTFAGNVAVNSFVTTANSGAITFKGASNSFTQAVDFLTTGTVSLGDAAGGGDEFLFDGGLAFSGNAAINLKGKILSSGDAITFGTGAIALLSNSSIDATKNAATGADIKIGGAISDGASSNTLTLNAGSAGDITASGSIGISKLEVVNAALNTATFEGNVTVDDFITNANNYSVAFTGAINSFTNAVTFLNTGALTLGDGFDDFAFTGGVTATAPSAITVAGTVSAAGTAPITLGDADTGVTVAGASTIGGGSTGAISLGAATLANKLTLTVGAGAATPITMSSVSGQAGSNLTIVTKAPVNVTGAVTNIGTVTITNSGGTTFADNVQVDKLVTNLNNPYTVSLTGSNNSISQTVYFLNTGLVTLGDAAGTDQFLFNGGLVFTGNAASTIGGVIRSSGDGIIFGSGGVTLLASSSVDTTNSGANAAGGPVTFGGTVNGTAGGAAEALTITAASPNTPNGGNVTFTGAVGGTTALGAITVNTSGQTLFNSTVNALSLYTDQPGTAILNGNITTTGAAGVQINEWTIGIQSGLTIDTTSGNGTVVLGGVGGAINSVGAAKDLTISSGTANVTVNSSIGATNALGALAINTSGATTFNSSVTATSVITDTPGTAILNGNITASGAAGVQIQELTIGLYSPVTIISAAGPVSLGGANGTINSETSENNNLTITAGNLITPMDVSILAAIGGTQRLGDIVINTAGATLFDAAVTAKSISTDQPGIAALNGNIDVNGSVGLSILELKIGINNPITINSSNGPVSLSSSGGAINSQTGETNNLTITAGNAKDVTLNAAVGGTERLGDIVINTSGATLFNGAVTATSISTDQPGTAALNGNLDVIGAAGVVIRELAITLNNNITIDSTSGPVALSSAGGAINSEANETNDLIITAGPTQNQNVTLNAVIGGTRALRDIKIYTDGLTALNASITAASLYTDGPGTASLGNSSSPMVIALSGLAGAQINELLGVTLNGPVTINTTNAPLTFAGPLDSMAGTSYNFTANAGTGAITFNGPVGGTTKPYNLILTGGDININATTQAMNVTMTGGNLNWNADIISPGFGTPGVPYGYHTFVGTINLLRNVTIEGNIGLINGTREYTTPRTVGGFTLTPRYNEDPVSPPQDPPNLLNNQLNMNQLAGSVPADLAPPSDPGPPLPSGKSGGPDADDKHRVSKAAADGRVCLLTGDGLCVAPSREQTAGQPSADPAKQTSASTPAPEASPTTATPATPGAAALTAPLPAPLPPVSQAQ
jgi:filamentous hemagglutinin family protein